MASLVWTQRATQQKWWGLASSSDGTKIIASVNSGKIYRSVNSGVSFNALTSSSLPATGEWQCLASSSDGTVLFAGRRSGISGGIYVSKDSGENWVRTADQAIDANNNFYSISCGSNGVDAIACINGGTGANILICQNGLDAIPTWTTITKPGGSSTSWVGTACSATADCMYACTFTAVYRRNVSAGTWTTITPSGITAPWSLACSSDASVLWVCENGGNGKIAYSTNATSATPTWTTSSAPTNAGSGGTSTAWTSISCSTSGIYNVIACNNVGYIYTRGLFDIWVAQTSAGISPWYNVVSDSTGATLIASGSGISSGTAYIYTASQNPEPYICFKEGSKILCLIDGKETYIPVENMRKGTLVKTSDSGFLPVTFIGSSKIYNPANSLRYNDRLFICSKDKFPELTEDLIITGGHAILYDNLTEKEKAATIRQVGRIMIAENKYRLMAADDERALPYENEGLFNIWHFSLRNHEYDWNYGVYANGGLLVETASERVMQESSGMVLID